MALDAGGKLDGPLKPDGIRYLTVFDSGANYPQCLFWLCVAMAD